MIALLVAAFILYLYTPHLLFKFAAATKYDFITRKELPQVEEFFAAGLPSLFLNGLTWVTLWVAYRLRGEGPIIVDREAAAAAFMQQPDLSEYFADADVAPLFCYIGALALISWWSGRMYGGILRKIAKAGGDMQYVEAALAAHPPWREPDRPLPLWMRLAFAFWRLLLVIYRRGWRIFYSQYEQPLYPVVLRNSYAFVHTTHGLYHGIVFQLDKKRDGDLESIILIGVSKFSRRKEDESLRLGLNPITDMTGPLMIRWDEVTDINYPPDASVLQRKREFYDTKLREYASEKASRRRRLGRYARFLRRLP